MNKYLAIIVIGASAMLMGACSNANSADRPDEAKKTTVEVTESPAEEAADFTMESADEETKSDVTNKADKGSGTVRKLTTAEFINEVFDYKANPSKWVYKGSKPAIIDFYADWCGPCKRVAPIMEKLAKEYQGKMNFYKINTDEERELSGQVFGIKSIPSILFIPANNSQPMMYTGAYPEEQYRKLIKEILKVN